MICPSQKWGVPLKNSARAVEIYSRVYVKQRCFNHTRDRKRGDLEFQRGLQTHLQPILQLGTLWSNRGLIAVWNRCKSPRHIAPVQSEDRMTHPKTTSSWYAEHGRLKKKRSIISGSMRSSDRGVDRFAPGSPALKGASRDP